MKPIATQYRVQNDEHRAIPECGIFDAAAAWRADVSRTSEASNELTAKVEGAQVAHAGGPTRSDCQAHGMTFDNAGMYNDAQLSRTQPWRSRYPTPQNLKEYVRRSSISDG